MASGAPAAEVVGYEVVKPDGTLVEGCCDTLLAARQARIATGGAIRPITR